MKPFNGHRSSLNPYLSELLRRILGLLQQKPKIDSSKVAFKRLRANQNKVRQAIKADNVIPMDKLPNELVCSGNIACNTPNFNSCNLDDVDGIPIDGSKLVLDPLFYNDTTKITNDTHISTYNYMVSTHSALRVTYEADESGTILNRREVRFPSRPRVSHNTSIMQTYKYLVPCDCQANVTISGGGGGGAGLVGKDQYQNVVVGGGQSGHTVSHTYQLMEGQVIVVSIGMYGVGGYVEYDNTVADATPFYAVAGGDGSNTELWIEEKDGTEVTNSRIVALGGVGGRATDAVPHYYLSNTPWYKGEAMRNYFMARIASTNNINSLMRTTNAENSLAKLGLMARNSFEQGVQDLDARTTNAWITQQSVGGRACVNIFNYTDNKVFSSRGDNGGYGDVRIWLDTSA